MMQVIENNLQVRVKKKRVYVPFERKSPALFFSFFNLVSPAPFFGIGKSHTHAVGFEPTISPYTIFTGEDCHLN
jgi:hypothetical protein